MASPTQSGNYQIRGLAASPSAGYRVCFDASEAIGGASAGGYLDQCYNDVAWDGFDLPDGATAVNVTVGATTESTLRWTMAARSAGTVTSAAHANAIDDVRIEVYDDTTGDFVNGIYSDTDGPTRSTASPAGSYAVCFDPFDASGGGVSTGYVPQCYNDVAWDEIDVPVRRPAGFGLGGCRRRPDQRRTGLGRCDLRHGDRPVRQRAAR